MPLMLQLEQVPLFQFFDHDSIGKLAAFAKVITKAKSDAVLLHGENVPGIYVVGKGRVGVYPPGANSPLVIFNHGGSFGEMSFLEKTTASATIRAEDDHTQLAVFFQADLDKALQKDPVAAQNLYRGLAVTLSQKLRSTNEQVRTILGGTDGSHPPLANQVAIKSPLLNLQKQVNQLAQSVPAELESCIDLIDQLTERSQEKAASLAELRLRVSTVCQHHGSYVQTIKEHIAAVDNLIKSMEQFMDFSKLR